MELDSKTALIIKEVLPHGAQKELAKTLNIGQQYVSNALNGKYVPVRYKNKIVRALLQRYKQEVEENKKVQEEVNAVFNKENA